ncbi:HET-domain-containing protein [Annulohypoxylon truncatum]|uniref:HET-domain-containing protein n=1 Tax=Annulohypoxylon truncatum TaxID=327061 RepID=UPI00200832E2|nr:HET-domain-containing protein [Annulohypoxylon truncatum]KAI1207570.1 HET-domain-containing protein [Annulohypoxylon truncatum]
MHLLDVETRRLKKYVEEEDGKAVDEYAILSHRWLAREDEVLFQDIESDDQTPLIQKQGFYKLDQCCKEARRMNIKYVWIDSCCIDKLSSAELQEAINSMYRYYANAKICYVYLKDTTSTVEGSFELGENEDYFKRGWTLQELLAPKYVYFRDKSWLHLGDKVSLSGELSKITGIDSDILRGSENLRSYSIAQRMSWASRRKTTKGEDLAYSLIGLFDVNMPMLYGEGGTKAFLRLQEEIIKTSDDHSIFAWTGVKGSSGLLATSPAAFRKCGTVLGMESRSGNSPFSMTNRGLSITLALKPWVLDTYMALLNCKVQGALLETERLCIFLKRGVADDQYSRVCVDGKDISTRQNPDAESEAVPIFVKREHRIHATTHTNGFRIENTLAESYLIEGCWDPREQTVTFKPGTHEWRHVATLRLSNCGNIKTAMLGFDFGFNPTFLICESIVDPTIRFFNTSTTLLENDETISVWRTSTGVPLEWNRIESNPRRFDTALDNPYRGLWVLKGDRLDGLHVYLISAGILVTLFRGPGGWSLTFFQ